MGNADPEEVPVVPGLRQLEPDAEGPETLPLLRPDVEVAGPLPGLPGGDLDVAEHEPGLRDVARASPDQRGSRSPHQGRDEVIVLERRPPVLAGDHGIRHHVRILQLGPAGRLLGVLQRRGRGIVRLGIGPRPVDEDAPQEVPPVLALPERVPRVGRGRSWLGDRRGPVHEHIDGSSTPGRRIDLESGGHPIGIRAELERPPDPKAVSGASGEGQLPGGLARAHLHPGGVRTQRHELHGLPRPLDCDGERPERALHHESLRSAILDGPGGHAPISREARPVERRDHLRDGHGRLVSPGHRGRPGRAGIPRRGREQPAPVRWSPGTAAGQGGGVGVPIQSCQASSTPTDSAIAISARFSILLSSTQRGRRAVCASAPAIASTS